MDSATTRRGLTSLRWFLAAHLDDLPKDLIYKLGEWRGSSSELDDPLLGKVDGLSLEQIQKLCAAIEGVHRLYFGTMNGRELSLFLRELKGGGIQRRLAGDARREGKC